MPKILNYFFFLAGMGLLGADLHAFLRRVGFIRPSVNTMGTGIKLIPQSGGTSDGLADSCSTHSRTDAPRIRFRTAVGKACTFTFTSAASSQRS